MNGLREALKADFGVMLAEHFTKRACYYSKIDCIEYLSADVVTISDRIDGFLTVLWNEDLTDYVGFKLKGFHAWYVSRDNAAEDGFNPLITALEYYCTLKGNEMFPEKEVRKQAYMKLITFIRDENINIAANDMEELKAA